MPIPKLKPCDIILSRTDAWLSKAIRAFEKKRTGSARFSHAAMALGDLTEKQEVIESLWKIQRSPLAKYEKESIIIYRHKLLTDIERREISLIALSVSNAPYALLKIPLFALDAAFNTYFFTSKLGISSFKVCSNLAAWSYHQYFKQKSEDLFTSGVPFPKNSWQKRYAENGVFDTGWKSTSPDTIDDNNREEPELWEQVYAQDV